MHGSFPSHAVNWLFVESYPNFARKKKRERKKKRRKNGKRHTRQQERPIMDVQPLSCPITNAFKLTAEMIPDLGRGKKTASAVKDVGDQSDEACHPPPSQALFGSISYQVEFQMIHPETTGFNGQGRGACLTCKLQELLL